MATRAAGVLDELQCELAQLYDIPVDLRASEFHLGERRLCNLLLGRELQPAEDEQLLVRESAGELDVSLYIDASVLARLGAHNPLQSLGEGNLPDYCTALEGVSHFQYLVWSAQAGRQVSLLELELQAEVDKYAVAVRLLRRQGRADLERPLWRRLFDDAQFLPALSAETRHRYREASRHAAVFCRRQADLLWSRRFRPEAWLRALRELYRSPHHRKLRRALQ